MSTPGLPVIPGVEGLEPVGRGAFGVVYRGRQPALDRDVAVKVVAAPGTGGKAADRWRREIAAMGRLSNHPNILSPYSGGVTEDGSPYLLMPYVPGGSLADRMRASGPLPADEVVAVGVKLAGALSSAHGAGVLHRDLKPDNVLLSPYGEPQLTDFGIARLVDATTTGTRTIHATIAYAAPEVLTGDPASEASDVYGLAATLFACLTGAAPFPSGEHDSLVSLVTRIATQPPPDLRAAGVPAALADVVGRGLAKDPADRFGGTAAGLGRALEGVDAPGVPEEAPTAPVAVAVTPEPKPTATVPAASTGRYVPPPPRPVPRSVHPARRGPSAALLVVAAVVVLLVLGAGALALGGGRDDEEPDEEAVTSSSSTTPASTTPASTTVPETTAPETTAPETTAAPAAGTESVEGTATAYVQALVRNDLAAGYDLLTPGFQAAQSRENYEQYWTSQQPVSVDGPVTADEDAGTAVVAITGGGVSRNFTLRLLRTDDGTWLIDAPRPNG